MECPHVGDPLMVIRLIGGTLAAAVLGGGAVVFGYQGDPGYFRRVVGGPAESLVHGHQQDVWHQAARGEPGLCPCPRPRLRPPRSLCAPRGTALVWELSVRRLRDLWVPWLDLRCVDRHLRCGAHRWPGLSGGGQVCGKELSRRGA